MWTENTENDNHTIMRRVVKHLELHAPRLGTECINCSQVALAGSMVALFVLKPQADLWSASSGVRWKARC